MRETIFLNKPLRNDEIFVAASIESLQSITGMPTRKGLENAVISAGQIVNVVSDSYGFLPNERFFYAVEEKLIDAGVEYATRSINRENRSFAVDYILKDESYHIAVKNGTDKLTPMLRFTNSYDGSCKTSGHFGFFRQICSNGLHVAHSVVGFSVKHTAGNIQIVFPEIKTLVAKFMDNEFYSLHKKFEVLAEKPIHDLAGFVKYICGETKLFQYEASEKNPDPSLNSRMVMDLIRSEANILGTSPNLWLGYNAFNELLHGKLKKNFEQQKNIDSEIFEAVYQMAN